MLALLTAVALAAPPAVEPVVLVLQGTTTCAGAFVDDQGTIATAYHCVASGGRPSIETRDGRRATGRVIAVDPTWDLAVIRAAAFAGEPHLEVRSDPPALGDEVWAIGHPYGGRLPAGFLTGTLRWSASYGAVSAVGSRALQVSAPINPGNSGGPIVDGEGRLVGVVSRRIGGDGLGFAARADRLVELLANPNGMGPLGGTLSASLFANSWGGPHGTVSYGLRAEVGFRDRVFFDVSVATPFQARWETVQLGAASWIANEARLGLRQRLLRGQLTTRIDAWAGVAQLSSLTLEEGLDLSADQEALLIVGGTLAFPGLGFGFDVGAARSGDAWITRGAVLVTWPGTFWVF